MSDTDSVDSRLTTDNSCSGSRLSSDGAHGDSVPDGRQAAAAEFQARVQAGDYRGLFGGRMGELMSQAAAEAGVEDEIAIVRIVMARLMAEEEDAVTLAHAISRLATVSIQAARARRAIKGQQAEALTEALTTVLAELNGSGK